jgi:Tfp pilus assembly protein PilN
MAVRTLDLDFLNTERTRTRLGPLLLVAGLVATGAVVWRDRMLADQAYLLNQRIGDTRSAAQRTVPQAQDGPRDPKLLAQEVVRANAVLANLAVPWDALFGELESASNANVALLSIQPEGGGRKVQLAGEARRFEDLLAYVARLEGTDGFANVFLTEHEMRNAGTDRAVSFTIVADWIGRR